MAAKIGRNDPCPCGSGKKYKKCHGDGNAAAMPQTAERNVVRPRNLLETNVVLLYAVADIFGLKRGFRWKDVKRNISAEQISRLYRVIAELYPASTNVLSLLPKDDKLRAFYVGDMDPQLTGHNMARMGLYVDEMLFVAPLYNPHCAVNKLNPIHNPELFKIDTYKLIYFLYLLGPALNSGIVKFVPNPGIFDSSLQLDFLSAAYARANGKEVTKDSMENLRLDYSNDLHKVIRAESAEAREAQLRKMYPHLTDQEINLTLPYFEQLGKEQSSVVLTKEVEQRLIETAAQILAVRAGINTDTAIHICQYTGAIPYTGTSWRWQELLTAANNDAEKDNWTGLTEAFHSQEFGFLNNVERGFVGEFHSMKRLEGTRDYMRRVWQAADSKLNAGSAENSVADLQNELATEQEKASAEWARMRQETKQWIARVSDPDSTLEPVVNGKFNLSLPNNGFTTIVGQEKFASLENAETVKTKVPAAVYIELT